MVKSLLLTAYTLYAFLYAQNIDTIGNSFLLGISLLALLKLYRSPMPTVQVKAGVRIFTTLFGLAFVTTLFPLWEYSHLDWTFSSACKFVLCYVVVAVFAIHDPGDEKLLKTTTLSLCVGLSLLMLLQNSGFEVKALLHFTGFHPVDNDWNEKYHSFWLVSLLWISIFYTWNDDVRSKLLTACVVIYGSVAIFTSYSQSSQLALVVAVIVFLISKLSKKGLWKICMVCLIAYVLLFPVIWQVFPFSEWDWLPERLYIRVLLFETASNAITNQWFGGYGFGATLTLPIGGHLPESAPPTDALAWLATGHNGLFPGAHPHNLVALIWLDFGCIGAIIFLILYTDSIVFYYQS